MKNRSRLAFALAGTLAALASQAVDDAQYQSIVRLGELNGIAMQCKFFGETRRMKKAMIASLPKRRALGEAFDEVTNQTYLAFIKNNARCPDANRFSQQVDEAIAVLRKRFALETAQ